MILILFPLICKSAYVYELENRTVTRDGKGGSPGVFLHPNKPPKVSSEMFWGFHNSFCPAATFENVALTHSSLVTFSHSEASRIALESSSQKSTSDKSSEGNMNETEVKEIGEIIVTIPEYEMTAIPLILRYDINRQEKKLGGTCRRRRRCKPL